jgi:long-chain acyl-CoA synthetase
VQTTFPRLMLEHARQRPNAAALREKIYGIWQTTTWSALSQEVRYLACGMAEAGLRRGDHIIAVGENRPRLYAAMLAAQALGAIPVPLYQDAVATEFSYPINNADVRFAVVEDQEQVDKLLEIRPQCPQLTRIWFDDPRGLRKYDEPGLASLDDLIEAGKVRHAREPKFFDAEVATGEPQDVAAMFFTSGTTGNPKGVVHSHFTLLDRANAGKSFDQLTESEEVLAYLPPAWIGQNIFSYAQWLACGYVVNCPESAATVMIDLKEVGPTYYFAPPRIFEGLLTSVMIRMEDAGAFKKWLFHTCMAVARRVGPARMDGKPVSFIDNLKWQLGNLFIFGPLRNTLGFSRVRVAYTAGEAIGPDLFTFYRSVGINLKQLYGSTETAVFVCLQPDHEVRADTVGVPIDGVEIKLAESGEILVKSPGLLKEYYKNPAATAEVLTPEGWYHTGDAGFIDASGHLKIIDRAKDVGRIKGGPNDGAMFAPKYVENKLKFFPHIKEAVAFGDGRDHACAFLNIDFEAVGNWAEKRNLPYAGYTDLAGKPEVYELIRECVEKVRGFIADKYAVLIDALYGGKTEQFIETAVKFEDGRTGSVSATLKISDVKTFPAIKRAA